MAKGKLEITSIEQEVGVSEKGSKLIEKKSIVDFELNAEIVAGSLTTNAKELKSAVEEELKNYSIEKYIENPDAAKTDKALLNKICDAVATKRKEITSAWNKPLDEFLTEMKGLETTIKSASDKINDIVKAAKQQEENQKRNLIENYWKTLDFTIIPLDKIFNPKWLNKTYKMEQVMSDLDGITEKIQSELTTIKSMPDEDSEILMSFYLDTLDLNATLQKGNQLKANRERLKALKEQEEKDALKTIQPEPSVTTTVPQQNDTQNQDPYMDYTLCLHGKKSSLFKLKAEMEKLGITYTKL